MNMINEDLKRTILNRLIELNNIYKDKHGCINGTMAIADFVRLVYPHAENMPTTDFRYGKKTAIDDIRCHMDGFDDWDLYYLFFDYLELHKISDDNFIYFIKQIVSPSIERSYFDHDKEEFVSLTPKYAESINDFLSRVGIQLKEKSRLGEKIEYDIHYDNAGVSGNIKNIIFACTQKPDISLNDALNNTVKIHDNDDGCLVYAENDLDNGLYFDRLKEWYENDRFHFDSLEERLLKSIGHSSPPERYFFNAYLELAIANNMKIPALLPQVYLYYDPQLSKDRIVKIYEHQRMDFMMILSNSIRIVIEIDGIQHYADDNKNASVDKYAAMVSAHRDMTLAGYDVYRFGGKELCEPEKAKRLVKQFFVSLFDKYKIDINEVT